MPELPEVERVRRSLVDHVVGRRIARVDLHRQDVVDFGTLAPRTAAAKRVALLEGKLLTAVDRRGKQLAVMSDDQDSPALCIHLGMTGALLHQSVDSVAAPSKHTHVHWHLDDGSAMTFLDPRRFGGVWCLRSYRALVATRWSRLGDDALAIEPATLRNRLGATTRGLKAALLDQSVIAGLGNIYVDELLFTLGLHPKKKANRLNAKGVEQLVLAMRHLLERALAAGGSTLRNYVDADGKAGKFQFEHRVYGRGGQPCFKCQAALRSHVIAGRTTVYCPRCQKRS